MKSYTNYSLLFKSVLLFFSFTLIELTSCKKPTSDNLPPVANFVKTQGHIYQDATVDRNTTVIVGVEATKSGDDLIRYINLFCSYNGRADSLIYQEFLAGTGTSYSRDFYINTGDTAYAEKYRVEVHSYLGQETDLHITLNVK
jgi:hypothetical protein